MFLFNRKCTYFTLLLSLSLWPVVPALAAAKPFTSDPLLQLCVEDTTALASEQRIQIGGEEFVGAHSVITAHSLQQLGISFEIQRLPWERCLHRVNQNELDGAIGVGWTAQPAKPWCSQPYPMALRPSSWHSFGSIISFTATGITICNGMVSAFISCDLA